MQGLKIAAGDAALFARDSIRIDTVIDIQQSPERVFNFVTTPALWHTWHPATVSVRETPDRPLVKGETMLELITVAGHRNEALES